MTIILPQNISLSMANHKSAQKRSRQNSKKSKNNKMLSSRIKNSYNKVANSLLGSKKQLEASESLKLYNSLLSKGIKTGIIKKKYASRKLSSLSKRIKKIT